MTNHVHLLAVPGRTDSLAHRVGMVHQRHARRIHAARAWTGHLWANRHHSTPLDNEHLWTAEALDRLRGRTVGARRRGRKPIPREGEENQMELFQ